MEKEDHKKSPKENIGKSSRSFIQYTDVAVRMIVIILAGVFGGKKLDEWLELKTPIFTLILSLVAVGMAMYVVIKGVTKK